eukprot:GEZU01029464.1.p1 GENE.GEZU01029464.1~~GEZU01029464.1.p1  ORF type:complete len:216 (-),score=69.76 GEZU01029464.1:106-681(-)
MPKTVHASQEVKVPQGVTVSVASRVVTVTGKRGTLKKSFKHTTLDIFTQKAEDGSVSVKVELWFGDRRRLSTIRTVCSHIENMITGVTKGYRYKMRFVYAHFPVNVVISDKNDNIEIRNFLGEKIVRRVAMPEGVTIKMGTIKDEIILEGNDIEKVSQSAANIHHSCEVKGKDIRKFLDGIYVSEKGAIEE